MQRVGVTADRYVDLPLLNINLSTLLYPYIYNMQSSYKILTIQITCNYCTFSYFQ